MAAFTALPAELSSDFDAHRITLTTRQTYLRLDTGRASAADQLWAAVKARGNTRLLAAATAEILDDPDLDADEAVDRAEERHRDANAARSARLSGATANDDDDMGDKPDAGDAPRAAAATEAVTGALAALRQLLADLRAGEQLTGYEAGSLRLCINELAVFLPAAEGQRQAS